MPTNTELVAPADWKNNIHWFEDVPECVREKWARLTCATTFEWEGQTCVVISYPRKSGRVALYDLDAGEISWVPLSDLVTCPMGRKVGEGDFFWSAIMGSKLCDEAADIWHRLEEV